MSSAFKKEDSEAGVRVNKERVARHDAEVLPRIKTLRGEGLGWRRIARALNNEGIPAPGHFYTDSKWHPNSVRRIALRNGIK